MMVDDDADDDVRRRKANSEDGLHRQEALPYHFDHLLSSHLAAKLSTSLHKALLSNHTP